jgi:cob(I)alamin adenosyltransferase
MLGSIRKKYRDCLCPACLKAIARNAEKGKPMITDKAPRSGPAARKFRKKGLIIVHTGDGKGKSTAAFGTALRALGHGYKVAMVQFIKGRWNTGEAKAFRQFGRQFDLFGFGDGFTWETKNFEKDVRITREAWKKVCELLQDDVHSLVVLDEINYVMKYNFLETAEVVAELQRKPAMKHVILTGNGAPKALIKIADLVSEVKCIKHPFYEGIPAQPGIEY